MGRQAEIEQGQGGDKGSNGAFLSDADRAARALSLDACILARDSAPSARTISAENAASGLGKLGGTDGSLKPESAEALRRAGAKVEEKPFKPDPENARYFNDLKGLKTSSITFDTKSNCTGAAVGKIELNLFPSLAGHGKGQNVTIKLQESLAGKSMPNSSEVGLINGVPHSNVSNLPDGTVEDLQLGPSGQLDRKTVIYPNKVSEVTDYKSGSVERGKEIPERVTKYNADGSREIVLFDKGVPSEKLLVKDNKLVSYNAYKDGKELSSMHPYSLAGKSYYKALEAADSAMDFARTAPLALEKVMKELRLMTTR